MAEKNITAFRQGNKWVFSDGTILPVVSGGAEGEGGAGDGTSGGDGGGGSGGTGGGAGAGGDGGSGGGSGSGGKTFTQEDITRIATREKQEGRTAATAELLKQLGVDNLEDAKAALKRHRDAEDATKTEAQRLADKAAKDSSEAAIARAEAAQERMAAKIERALVRSGVADATLDDVAKLVSVPTDADDATIKAAVDALKERMPMLFTPGEQEPGNGKPPRSDPGRGPGSKPPGDAQGQAKSILEQRHGPALARNKGK